MRINFFSLFSNLFVYHELRVRVCVYHLHVYCTHTHTHTHSHTTDYQYFSVLTTYSCTTDSESMLRNINQYVAGNIKYALSIRSNNPPTPGNTSPVSFNDNALFTYDIDKSPKIPSTTTMMENRTQSYAKYFFMNQIDNTVMIVPPT